MLSTASAFYLTPQRWRGWWRLSRGVAGWAFLAPGGHVDAAGDWPGEELGEAAGAALHGLTVELEGGEAAGKVAPDFRGDRLWPEAIREVRRTPALMVMRQSESAGKEPVLLGPGGWRRAMDSLKQRLKGARDVHVKIKTVTVDRTKLPALTTRHLVAVTAESKDGPFEINAAWEAQWTVSGKDAEPHPVLHGLRVSGCEEVRATGGRAWLTEATDAVLAGAADARAQISRGNDYWRARLQKWLEYHLFGHHGLAAGDVNGDGRDDIYLCQGGGLPNRLLVQNADGTVTDRSAESGVDFLELTRSALFLDLDNDGDQDLVAALLTGVALMENDGAGKFTARARLPQANDAYSLAAADYDGNGFVDFYVCGYQSRESDPSRLPVPTPYFDARNGGENFLVRNEGGWRFTNATAETGLDADNNRFSFAAVWLDWNADGLPDLAVANDFGQANLYEQRRSADGRPAFADVAAAAGLDRSAFGMSVAAGDPNRDGAFDLYTANMFSSAGNRIAFQPEFKPEVTEAIRDRFRHMAQGNCLFLNEGGRRFAENGESAGVAMGRWSWGSLFADLDSDGWEDLLVANGYVTGRGKAPDL